MNLRSTLLISFLLIGGCADDSALRDAEFVALSERYIEALLEMNPEYATYLGDHRYDHSLNDYSAAGIAESMALDKQFLAEIEAFDPAGLSEANAIDYEILDNRIRYSLWASEELREWEWNPMHYNVGGAVYSLLARDFAPLEERLRNLDERLKEVPAVVEAAKANLKNPPKIHTETAILQNPGVIALLAEQLDTFLAQAPEFKSSIEVSRKAAIEALEAYGKWLDEDLLPRSNGDFRIGEEKFRKKLAFVLHSDLSMEEILARAEKKLAENREAMYATALPLYRQARPDGDVSDRGAVIETVLDKLSDTHPTSESIFSDAERDLAEITAFTREKNLVSVPDEPVSIILMPEFQRGVSTAYCDAPGPLEKGGETFYAIAPAPEAWSEERKLSLYREYNTYMLKNLTVHEAVPGHYLQLAHANRFQAPTLIRGIFYSGSFVEGWAVYAEQLMSEHGYGGPEVKMQVLKMAVRGIINAIIDQKIHAGSMTESEAMALMMDEGFQEDGEAAGKWTRARLTSAQLSTYFVGAAEHNDIRDDWVARHGAIADWQAYHDKVLAYGSPPAKFVRRMLGL